MSTKRIFAVGILSILSVLALYRLYAASESRRDALVALHDVVLTDVTNVEDFLMTYSVRMEKWNRYLSIPDLKASLFRDSDISREYVKSFLVNLKFAHGVEKYPPISALRDSLMEFRKLEETSVFESIWSPLPSAKAFLTVRASRPAVPFTLPMVAAKENSNVPATLQEAEEMFFEQTADSLPSPPSAALFEADSNDLASASSLKYKEKDTENIAEKSEEISAVNNETVNNSAVNNEAVNNEAELRTESPTASEVQTQIVAAHSPEEVAAAANYPVDSPISAPRSRRPLQTSSRLHRMISVSAEKKNDSGFSSLRGETVVSESSEKMKQETPSSGKTNVNTEIKTDADANVRSEANAVEVRVKNAAEEDNSPAVPSLEPISAACVVPGNEKCTVSAAGAVPAVGRLQKISEFPQEEAIPDTVSAKSESSDVQSAASVKTSSDVHETQNTSNVRNTQNVQNALKVQNSENVQNAQDVSNAENVQKSQDSGGINEEEMTEDASAGEMFVPETLPQIPSMHYTLQKQLDAVSEKLFSDETEADSKAQEQNLFLKQAELWNKCAYKAPTEADLSAAYSEVRAAANYVNKLFAKSSAEKRAQWVRFLHWDVLHVNEPADPAALEEVYHQLSCGAFGLELEFFVRLRLAIGHYLALEAQMQAPDSAESLFKAAKKEMAALLAVAQKNAASQTQRAVENLLGWMQQMGQAPELVETTAELWAQPNVIVNMNQSVFEKYGSRLIEEEQQVQEQIRRASIRGTMQFCGNLSVHPVQNQDRIELQITLDGASDSRTKAYAGPAIISTRASSRILVNKNIFIDEDGFDSTSAQVQIRTNSRIENVQDKYNRHLVESFAKRRAFLQKDETEQAANSQSVVRLRQRFNRSVDEILEDWNLKLSENGKRQFAPRGLTPAAHMWSDESGIHVEAQVACRDGFTAPALPKEINDTYDIHFAIHETAIQGVFQGFLANMNLNESARSQFEATAPEWIQKTLSARMNGVENAESGESATSAEPGNASETAKTQKNSAVGKNWEMRFAPNWPVSASFDDGMMTFCIHNSAMEYDGKSYPAVNITVSYKIEPRDEGFALVRQGNVEILPPDFNPEVQKRLPSSMVSLRRVMAKRLEKAFAAEILLKESRLLKNAKEDSRFANLYVQPVFFEAEDGWLQIGMNFRDKKPENP